MSDATPPPPNPYQADNQLSPADEKMWATLIHVLGIFFGFLPALIGYLLLKDRGPFVRQHSASALNFQLTMLIAAIIGWITAFIIIGFLILFAVEVLVIVFSIIAAIAANRGESYTYPLSIKFLS
ncbi:MAG TPA: DUF4870 domain-containing protein [Humibacter sp.]|jgi:uncharacterized Tic20 family protein|nr:DUF4870 domain-containing protein [Humibacter sp.]